MSLAVVIISCDNYSDLWTPFIYQFKRYWADCPYPIYLTSNHKVVAYPGIWNLPVGDDLSWSGNLLKALEAVDEEFVLMFIEDLFLVAPVQRERLEAVMAWAAEARPNHVRLNRTEPATRPHNALVGEIEPGAPYRTSTVLSLWNKQALLSLLKAGENAWQFEFQGSVRSDALGQFYTVHQDCFPVTNGVIKGKWTRQAVLKLQAQGVTLDLDHRPVMTLGESLRFGLIRIRAAVFKCVPWKLRRSLRRRLN